MSSLIRTVDSSRFSHMKSLFDDADANRDNNDGGDSILITDGIIYRSSVAENGQPPDCIGSLVTVKVTDNKAPSLARKRIVNRFNYRRPLQFEVTKNLGRALRLGEVMVRNNSGTTVAARYRRIYAIPHPKNSLPVGGWDQFFEKLTREQT